MITIVDYGMGNLGSIRNMLKRIGVPSVVTGDVKEIASAEKLILPGVGAFDAAIQRINDSGLRETLDARVLDEKVPILGICLGMQLLTLRSDEGELPGLGWIEADTNRIPAGDGLKIPHMGWNVVVSENKSRLTDNLDAESRFYFVHSYCVHVRHPEHSILKTDYGIRFDSAIASENIYGAQFHPEKSHRFGMALLENFAKL